MSVGAVILHGGNIVLVKRAKEPLKGEWSVPGGALEVGETLRHGVEREVLEETGLRVECGELVAVLDRIYPDADGRCQFHYVLVDFLCTLAPGESSENLRAAADADDARWISTEAIATWPMQEALRQVLMKVVSRG